MLDLGKVRSQFEIVHPKAEVEPSYADVKFSQSLSPVTYLSSFMKHPRRKAERSTPVSL